MSNNDVVLKIETYVAIAIKLLLEQNVPKMPTKAVICDQLLYS